MPPNFAGIVLTLLANLARHGLTADTCIGRRKIFAGRNKQHPQRRNTGQ